MNVTCSFGKENEKFGNCGSWHPSSTRLPNEDVVPLRSLTRDVTHLLRNIRASGSKVADSHRVKAIAEWELILNLSQNMRLSEKEIGGMTICPRHRKNLTRLRDRKAKCCSPLLTMFLKMSSQNYYQQGEAGIFSLQEFFFSLNACAGFFLWLKPSARFFFLKYSFAYRLK